MMPSRRRLREAEEDYRILYEDWERIDLNYKTLYAKHLDLVEEVRYWETRHARIMNFIEKQMEMSEGAK